MCQNMRLNANENRFRFASAMPRQTMQRPLRLCSRLIDVVHVEWIRSVCPLIDDCFSTTSDLCNVLDRCMRQNNTASDVLIHPWIDWTRNGDDRDHRTAHRFAGERTSNGPMDNRAKIPDSTN